MNEPLLARALDALNGVVGLVQLVSDRRYPDFPVDNHRVLEARSCANAIARALSPCDTARGAPCPDCGYSCGHDIECPATITA
jgi:hypothetical protein